MNFWNDPSQNASKSVLLIAILALVGVGIYQFAGTPDNSQTGRVIQGTKYNTLTETADPGIKNCSYYSTGGNEGASCKVQTNSCQTYSGTVQDCPDGSNPEFGCCCASQNDTCYPVNQMVDKGGAQININVDTTPISGGQTKPSVGGSGTTTVGN